MINQNLKINSNSNTKPVSHKINQHNLDSNSILQDKILKLKQSSQQTKIQNSNSNSNSNSNNEYTKKSLVSNYLDNNLDKHLNDTLENSLDKILSTEKAQNNHTQQSQPFIIEAAQQNWKRELAQSFKSPIELLRYLNLEPDDFTPAQQVLLKDFQFPMLITKFFVDLMEKGNINDPLLKQILPLSDELITRDDFVLQPLDEQDQFVPVNNIVHKYKDRLLFMPKGGCAINCRYCFRRNFPYHELVSAKSEWIKALDYVYQQQIKELILSGGDPLMMSDNEFDWLGQEIISRNLQVAKNLEVAAEVNSKLSSEENLYKASNEKNGNIKDKARIRISRLRIHSRLPVVLPYRINDRFIQTCQNLLDHNIKVVLVTHINHSQELSPELQQKVAKLKTIGVVVLNQSVLLKDINDNAQVLAQLSEDLFFAGIMPYYLHLLDKVKGAVHFYVEEVQAHTIYKELQTLVSGYLVPKLAREEVGRPFKTLYGTDHLQQKSNS